MEAGSDEGGLQFRAAWPRCGVAGGVGMFALGVATCGNKGRLCQ